MANIGKDCQDFGVKAASLEQQESTHSRDIQLSDREGFQFRSEPDGQFEYGSATYKTDLGFQARQPQYQAGGLFRHFELAPSRRKKEPDQLGFALGLTLRRVPSNTMIVGDDSPVAVFIERFYPFDIADALMKLVAQRNSLMTMIGD